MKTYSLEDLTDKYIGKKGTEKRDAFENELRIDLLGQAIKQARQERNLTQEQLGELVGVQKAQISKIENSVKNARLETILKVFDALGAKVNFSVVFRHTKILLCLFFLSHVIFAQVKKNTSGNPIVEGWYADPEGVILNHKFWVFPTFSAKYKDQVFMDAFSSKDLVTWTKHPRIIDTSAIKWAKMAMWAPSIVQKDKKYFLFFSANDIQSAERKGFGPNNPDKDDKVGGIGIGVASRPKGPYKDYLGKPLINQFYNKAQPIDQFVFQDKDKQYYIIYGGWGHCNIGQLNADFTALVPFSNGELVKEITPKGYVEGPTMFIRKGKYYLMWSEGGWTNGTYKLAYSAADSVFGPFEKKSMILVANESIATGAGHHSVINIPRTDDWYIVYHRRPIPNQGRDHRVVCIDRLYFNEDDTIKEVKMTFEGVTRKLK